MTEQEPAAVAAWQKVAALIVSGALCGILVLFRHRLGADFWPLDASRIGPNLIASAIVWAALFVLAVLLWPPTRRRLHRFLDRKFDRLHAKVDALALRHDEHAQSLAALHQKVDALTKERAPQ
jgi:uncharacterized membrane protein YccC